MLTTWSSRASVVSVAGPCMKLAPRSTTATVPFIVTLRTRVPGRDVGAERLGGLGARGPRDQRGEGVLDGRAGPVDGHELLALGEEDLDRRRSARGAGARAGQCEDHGEESREAERRVPHGGNATRRRLPTHPDLRHAPGTRSCRAPARVRAVPTRSWARPSAAPLRRAEVGRGHPPVGAERRRRRGDARSVLPRERPPARERHAGAVPGHAQRVRIRARVPVRRWR